MGTDSPQALNNFPPSAKNWCLLPFIMLRTAGWKRWKKGRGGGKRWKWSFNMKSQTGLYLLISNKFELHGSGLSTCAPKNHEQHNVQLGMTTWIGGRCPCPWNEMIFEVSKPFYGSDTSVQWNWDVKGSKYWENKEFCPFCHGTIDIKHLHGFKKWLDRTMKEKLLRVNH